MNRSAPDGSRTSHPLARPWSAHVGLTADALWRPPAAAITSTAVPTDTAPGAVAVTVHIGDTELRDLVVDAVRDRRPVTQALTLDPGDRPTGSLCVECFDEMPDPTTDGMCSPDCRKARKRRDGIHA